VKIKTGKGIIPTWATIQTQFLVWYAASDNVVWPDKKLFPLSPCHQQLNPFPSTTRHGQPHRHFFVDTNFANVKVFLKKILWPTVRNKHFPNNKSLRIIYISGSNNELRPDELKVKNDKDPHKLFAVLIFSNILWFKISHETMTFQVLC
jgi:hypothetical protein